MFLQTTTQMSEFMTIYASHFGCIISTILTEMRQMYIDGSCPGLGIDIKISGLWVGPSVIDPNEGCCIMRCTILIDAYHSQGRGQVEKIHREIFSCAFL